jgi:outer membrane protein OmpA-like peptidoglycan-associated protein
MRVTARLLLSIALGAVLVAPTAAHAQVAGFALDQFNPSERGSDWFELDSLDLRGNAREAVGIVGDYAYLPLAIYNSDGTLRARLVQDQVFLHVGLNMVFFDRIRIGLNLPVAVYATGQSGTLDGVTYTAPGPFSVGDLRIGADLRIAGAYGDPFRLAVGVQVFAPVGFRSDYTSDGMTRVQPRLMVAGDAGVFAYALQAGFLYSSLTDSFGRAALGSQVNFGGSVGLFAFDHALLIGPEVYGATNVAHDDLFFKKDTTPVEGILGAHIRVSPGWHFGIGGGAGLTRGFGAPAARALALIEWAPEVTKPPSDRDGDGIVDTDDACPDVAGVRTDDPKTNGCPPDRDGDGILDPDDACPDIKGVKTDDPKTNGCPPDRDGDGIYDVDDACPDVKGVKTDDPKTNGCPPDRDGDGILDPDDACPDVKGVKTDDPKTNGCPPDPDRDKDGILNADDACPDEPGPKNADPKKNGCPQAVVRNDQIVILEQVQFRTNSAEILPESESILQAVLKVMNEHTEIGRVSIEGHTDNRGTAQYNQALSTRRAASVVQWLLQHGIGESRLTSIGYGMDRPIDTNATDAGRRNNRRVEFHIVPSVK